MIKLNIIALLICISICKSTLVSAQPADNTTLVDIQLYFTANKESLLGGMKFRGVRKDDSSRFSYQAALLTFSATYREDVMQYSFQGVINGFSALMTTALNGLIFSPGNYSWYATKLRYLTMLPSSSVTYDLKPDFAFTLETNTEYLFARINGSKRGMLFTPTIGMIKRFRLNSQFCGSSALHLTVGPTWFINFEGTSKLDGIAAQISWSGGFPCD